MLLLVLHNNFITVVDALVFLEVLVNPSVKPFSSLVLQAAASPLAFHPLPCASRCPLAAATRVSLGRRGRFICTGVHVALGSGEWAHCIPARRGYIYKNDAVLEPPTWRGLANLSTDLHASPPHHSFGETSWQVVSCFSSQKLKQGRWVEEREQLQPAFKDEEG